MSDETRTLELVESFVMKVREADQIVRSHLDRHAIPRPHGRELVTDDDVVLRFHGYGCRVTRPDGETVDFDWVNGGIGEPLVIDCWHLCRWSATVGTEALQIDEVQRAVLELIERGALRLGTNHSGIVDPIDGQTTDP